MVAPRAATAAGELPAAVQAGRAEGDGALEAAAPRAIGIVYCRPGDAEAWLDFPRRCLTRARAAAERIRAAVAELDWSRPRPAPQVAVSIGLAQRHEAGSPQDLLRLADARLYSAKGAGRNRVGAE